MKTNDILSILDVHPLSEDIYISHGSPVLDESVQGRAKDPRLIVIFSWMEASVPVVFSKYAIKHRNMYPNSDIVVVRSRIELVWSAEKQRQDAIQPLANLVIQTLYMQDPEATEGALLHVLSDGGAFHLLIFSELLHRLFASSSGKTVSRVRTSVILDSTPGNGDWTSTYESILNKLPVAIHKPARSVMKEGLDGLFARLHSCLMKEDIMPCSTPLAPPPHPRLYVYSTADEVVPSSSVDTHLSQFLRARSLIYRENGVWVRRIDGVEHLAGERVLGTVKEDGVAVKGPTYWELVRTIWDASASVKVKPNL